jgi:hypothetical protein
VTIADTIHDVINDNWGNGGYGGTAPTITTSETTKTETRTKTDVVEIRHFTLDERHRQVNDKYADKFYTVVVRVTSKTSAAQLDLLVDEVEYLLRNTTMTGVQFRSLRKSYTPTSREFGVHGCEMFVEVVAYLSSGTVTTAAGASTNITADTLVFEDGGATVDIIRDEDDMASDDAAALATQQSIKAYADAIGTAAAADVDADIVTHTAIEAAHGMEHDDLTDTTLTGAQLEDLLMFGSGNTTWYPCSWIGHSGTTRDYYISLGTGHISNLNANDAGLRFDLMTPTVKGGLKLYITGSRVVINDADAGDYIDTTTVYGYTNSALTALNQDATDYNSPAVWDDTFGAVDCSSYNGVFVFLNTVVTDANDLDLAGVFLQCYYAT